MRMTHIQAAPARLFLPASAINTTRTSSVPAPQLYSLQLGVAAESHRCISTTRAQWRGLERAPSDAGCKNLRMEIHLLSIRCAGANASPAMRCVRRPLRTMQHASVLQRAPKNAAADAARALHWHTPDAVAATHASTPSPRPAPNAVAALTHATTAHETPPPRRHN